MQPEVALPALIRPPARHDAGQEHLELGGSAARPPKLLKGPNGEDLGQSNYTLFYHGVRESLPTTSERQALRRAGLIRDNRLARRSHFATSFHLQVYTMYDLSVVAPFESQADSPLLRCYYVAHTRAHVAQIGKRAFRRVQARRKLREAARRVLPWYGLRGMEYVMRAQVEILFMDSEDVERELIEALKGTQCYVGNQSSDPFAQDRPFLSDKAGVSWRRWRSAVRSVLKSGLDESGS